MVEQAGHPLTDNVPNSDLKLALPSTVATMESSCPLPQPAWLVHKSGGTSDALSFVPSILPDPMDLGELARLKVKFLPDWEMFSAVSWVGKKECAQVRPAN